MKNTLLAAFGALVLFAVVGCSCDKKDTTTSQSASMQTDTKDMHSTH
jgi:hypothetical protein